MWQIAESNQAKRGTPFGVGETGGLDCLQYKRTDLSIRAGTSVRLRASKSGRTSTAYYDRVVDSILV